MIEWQFRNGNPRPLYTRLFCSEIHSQALRVRLYRLTDWQSAMTSWVRQRDEGERRAFSKWHADCRPIFVAIFPSASSRPRFTDVTAKLGLHYQNEVSHSPRKYLIETMEPGVALFDYDNGGRLDIFVANGASPEDPTPKGTIPEETGSKHGNRLYYEKPDDTFEDVTEKAGLRGRATAGMCGGRLRQERLGGPLHYGVRANKLYHSNEDRTFGT